MPLDNRTLLVAVGLTTAVCTVARVLLCRLHPAIPGLARWAWGSVLASLALLLIAARDANPDILPSLAQAMITAGFIVTWDGFRSFVGRQRFSPSVIALLVTMPLIPIGFARIEHSLELRSVVNSILIAVVCAMIARELLRAASPAHIARRATGWIYAVNGFFFFLRGIVSACDTGGRKMSELANDGLFSGTLMWWLGMSIAVTLGMILMAGERLQLSLDRQASQDPLTGALNRRAFTLAADKEMARARRNGQPLSLLMMDLDHFKQINDRLGHAGGDAMLCLFVTVASRVLRDIDIFCRFGGEEFVALLPGSSAVQALAVAERLREAYGRETARMAVPAEPLPFAFTVSIGVGEMHAEEGIEDVISRADTALYRAKATGRNRCELAAIFTTAESAAVPG